MKCSIVTGPGPNLVIESFLHPTCTSCIKRQNLSLLKSAKNSQPTQMGDRVTPTKSQSPHTLWFGVFVSLAIDSLLRATLVKIYIRNFFIAKRELVPWYLPPCFIIVPATNNADAVAVADHINSQLYVSPLAEDIYYRVVVAKAATMAPHAHKPVLEKRFGSKIRAVNAIDNSTSHATLDIARRIVNVDSDKSFYILLTNMSNKLVHLLKRLIVTQLKNSTIHNTATDAALLKNDPETLCAVYYRLLVDRDTQMTHHKDAEARNDQNL